MAARGRSSGAIRAGTDQDFRARLRIEKTPSKAPGRQLRIGAESGRSIRRGILNVGIRSVARIVHHVRRCLQHNWCGGNHPLLEGGELGVGHVAEPFGNRIGRKMQIER